MIESFHVVRRERHYGGIREPFEKFVDWRQCAAVMQREA
jgi:hypothetical protein